MLPNQSLGCRVGASEKLGIAPRKVPVVGVGADQARVTWSRVIGASLAFLFVGIDWARKNGDAVVAHCSPTRAAASRSPRRLGRHPPLAEPGINGHGVLRLDVP